MKIPRKIKKDKMEIKGKDNAVRWREEKNGNPKNMKVQRKKKKAMEI